MRLIDADTLNYVRVRIYHDDGTIGGYNAVVPSSEIKNSPTVEAIPVIRCKDCKHRPIVIDAEGNGFDYDFPDERCPCQCEDGWYNWMPRDEWYCANGERKDNETD